MRSRLEGFVLVEVLVSVIILSVGLLAVFRPLLRSLSVTARAEQRLEIDRLLSNQLWNIRTEMAKKGTAPSGVLRGILPGRQRVYPFAISVHPLSESEQLFRLDSQVQWAGAGKEENVKRSVYVSVPHAMHV